MIENGLLFETSNVPKKMVVSILTYSIVAASSHCLKRYSLVRRAISQQSVCVKFHV